MTPSHPRLLPDRDKRFNWYLDEQVTIELPQNSSLTIPKGYRFDGHSSKEAIKLLLFSGTLLALLHFFPVYVLAALKLLTILGVIATVLVLTVFRPYHKKDVHCALVHDALIDFESLHRYNRKYQDMIYTKMMRSPEYKANSWRAFWMPTAVRFFGWFNYDLWGDYRGEPKPNTHIVIKVTND